MRKFTSKKEVAESIGSVYGPYEERDGLHILHYSYPDNYVYNNLDDLLLDWLPTIIYNHMDECHRDAQGNLWDSWYEEIDYILENVYSPRVMNNIDAIRDKVI